MTIRTDANNGGKMLSVDNHGNFVADRWYDNNASWLEIRLLCTASRGPVKYEYDMRWVATRGKCALVG